MKGAKPVEACLRDVIAYGRRLARHLDGVSRSEFLANEMIQDAAAKCVEAIGEAAGQIARLEPDLESRYPDLRLSDAYSARNRLSHGSPFDRLWRLVDYSDEVDPRNGRGREDRFGRA